MIAPRSWRLVMGTACFGALRWAQGFGTRAEEKYEPPPYMSEGKYSWPGRPGLTRLVADNAKEVMETDRR
eukprot:960472-Amorphochlora_amoeboformis.AAC.3